MYPSINKVYLEFHIHLKVNYNSELVWLSFCMKCYGIMWVNIYDQRLVRVAPPQNPFPQLLHPLLSRHRRSGYAVALIITILLVAKQARSKSDARFPSYRSSNRSKTKFAKYLSQSLQPYCLSIRSDGARTDGMRGGEQLSAPMSLCGRDRRLPWEESDQRARHFARRHHRAVSGASLNANGGASLWLGITNPLIFFFCSRLEQNFITELPPKSFSSFRRLRRIDLSNNNISRIAHDALSGLKQLTTL